jgi:EpsI family protein
MKVTTIAHYVAVLLLLLGVTGLHLHIIKTQIARGHKPLQSLDIPSRVADYVQEGDDIPPEEGVVETLQTSVILTRMYRSATGWPVQLSIVYAGSTRRSLHFPEVCIVGHGWEIQRQETVPVGILFNAKRLVIVKGEQREAVLYFFKTGDELTGNYFPQCLVLVAAATHTRHDYLGDDQVCQSHYRRW